MAIARPFNAYGPRQSARAVIPAVSSQLAKDSRVIKWGTFHPTRDFSFVGDTVQGFVAIAEKDRAIGEVANLGSNFEMALQKTADMIAGIMVKNLSIATEGIRLRPDPSDAERLRVANQKAKDHSDWQPYFAGPEGLNCGLEIKIDWFLNPENLAMYQTERYAV